MAERSESAEQNAGRGDEGPDPAATAFALNAASREQADAYLKQQSSLGQRQAVLVELQIQDLKREDRWRHWSLRVRHVTDVLQLCFAFGAALVVLVAVVGVGAALWSAAHENGLVFESFSVPQDLAQRGVTGQILANQLIDRIDAMRTSTFDVASPELKRDDQDELRIQIPDTGISLTEFYRIASRWLGHETPIAGEVYSSGPDIRLAIRIKGKAAHIYSGPAGSLAEQVNRAAEGLMAETEPARYGMFLFQKGKLREALAFYSQALPGVPDDELADYYKAWAWVIQATGDNNAVIAMAAQALIRQPDSDFAAGLTCGAHAVMGQDQLALEFGMRQLRASEHSDLPPASRDWSSATTRLWIDEELGDYAAAAAEAHNVHDKKSEFARYFPAAEVQELALNHDIASARRVAAASEFATDAAVNPFALYAVLPPLPYYSIDTARDDWPSAVKHLLEAVKEAEKPGSQLKGYVAAFYAPRLSLAYAMTGNLAAAHGNIDHSPRGCYECARVRGQIAALERNWPIAEHWFEDAIGQAPSVPLAYFEWGRMLLAKGDVEAAIAKFREANLKGPHFADPLEMWGEALMQQNRSDLALAKFEEANKYAPNWGRLHLEWGKALFYAGRKDEAKKQFALAAALDLSASDRTILLRMRTHG